MSAEELTDLPDVARMRQELIDLRASFLANTTKLGAICAAFGIPASLDPDAFALAVKAEASRIRALKAAAS